MVFGLGGVVGIVVPVERAIGRVVIPLAERSAYAVRVALSPLSVLAQSYRARSELEQLQKDHAIALSELSQLERVREENEALRRMLENRHLELKERSIAAPIVSYTQPTISAGTEQGVREGQLVSAGGVLLGTIDEVRDRQATVLLFTQPRRTEQVLVQTASGAEGILQGRGSYAVISHLSWLDPVVRGERVVTIGQPGIPAGELVGIVGQSVSDETEPFHSVRLEQLETFYKTPFVEVW